VTVCLAELRRELGRLPPPRHGDAKGDVRPEPEHAERADARGPDEAEHDLDARLDPAWSLERASSS